MERQQQRVAMRLKALRLELGWSQGRHAQKVGMTREYIAPLEAVSTTRR